MTNSILNDLTTELALPTSLTSDNQADAVNCFLCGRELNGLSEMAILTHTASHFDTYKPYHCADCHVRYGNRKLKGRCKNLRGDCKSYRVVTEREQADDNVAGGSYKPDLELLMEVLTRVSLSRMKDSSALDKACLEHLKQLTESQKKQLAGQSAVKVADNDSTFQFKKIYSELLKTPFGKRHLLADVLNDSKNPAKRARTQSESSDKSETVGLEGSKSVLPARNRFQNQFDDLPIPPSSNAGNDCFAENHSDFAPPKLLTAFDTGKDDQLLAIQRRLLEPKTTQDVDGQREPSPPSASTDSPAKFEVFEETSLAAGHETKKGMVVFATIADQNQQALQNSKNIFEKFGLNSPDETDVVDRNDNRGSVQSKSTNQESPLKSFQTAVDAFISKSFDDVSRKRAVVTPPDVLVDRSESLVAVRSEDLLECSTTPGAVTKSQSDSVMSKLTPLVGKKSGFDLETCETPLPRARKTFVLPSSKRIDRNDCDNTNTLGVGQTEIRKILRCSIDDDIECSFACTTIEQLRVHAFSTHMDFIIGDCKFKHRPNECPGGFPHKYFAEFKAHAQAKHSGKLWRAPPPEPITDFQNFKRLKILEFLISMGDNLLTDEYQGVRQKLNSAC